MSTLSSTVARLPEPDALHPRAVLIEASVVRALTGWRRDEIYDRVDGSTLLANGLQWVWNFAADSTGEIRDLRFWRDEIQTPERTRKLSIDQVIAKILPAKRSNFHSGEVLQMFAVGRPSLARLRADLGGAMAGTRNCFFSREQMAGFLKRRWLGRIELRPPTPGRTGRSA